MRSFLALCLASFVSASAASAQNVLYAEDFENGFSGWTMTGHWNEQEASEPCTAWLAPFPSGTHCAWYGRSETCTIEGGDISSHELTCTTPVVLPATNGVLEMTLRTHTRSEEDGVWDLRQLEVSTDDGATWVRSGDVFNSNALGMPITPVWRDEVFDLTRFAGSTIRFRFRFWIGDLWGNDYLGWLVDDVRIRERDASAVPTCLGDGSWRECPCNNQGAPGRGCATSFNPAGARLAATGFPSVSADSLVLSADGMSQGAATIIQSWLYLGSPYENFGGDAWICMRGSLARIRTLPAPGGAASYPAAGETPISVRGAIPAAGGQRHYVVRYRNAANFCTSSTFSATNGLSVFWRP